METLNTVLLLALAVIVVIVLIRVISAPIKLIFKLLINTVIGFAILFLVNLIGQNFGITKDHPVRNQADLQSRYRRP